MKRALPLSRVYRVLEPGPVVLLTTARKGRPNVMTLSWHTMMEFTPPLVGCVDPANRSRDRTKAFSLVGRRDLVGIDRGRHA